MPRLTDEQLAEYERGFGAHEVPMLLGVSRYGGLHGAIMRRLEPGERPAETLAQTLGHELEPIVARLIERQAEERGDCRMAVHRPCCPSVEEHVRLDMAERSDPFPSLPEYVATVLRDIAEERVLSTDIALADCWGVRDWTESELRFAGGDR